MTAIPQDGWSFDVDRLFADLIESGEAWADAEAAAELREETKKSVLSELKLMSGEKSDAARETEALASQRYRQHITEMVETRHQANRAKVRYTAIQTLAEMLRTKESTRRAEMNMTR